MDATLLSAGRFAIDVALKVTILVSLVLLLIAGLRRLSASSRHLLAMLGLAGALALPFVGPLAPSVAVPLVPSVLPAPAARQTESMGDIFRRNAFNLGLHVVQSPEAVADAGDGDLFSFDPRTRALENETQGKSYTPVPLTPKEEEIRSSGGIFAVGRREFRDSVLRQPEVMWPDPETARRLTSTEQIVCSR